MILSGRVVEVSAVTLGDVLAADHDAGSMRLTLSSTVDFEGAPEVALTDDAGATYLLAVVSVDDDAVTVASGLPVAFPAETFVAVWPSGDEKQASVIVEDGDDALSARVPHGLYDRMPEGVRSPGTEEAVEVSDDGGEWVISDVLGLVPTVDGTYIDPESLPAPPPVEPLPPEPPTAPTFSVTGLPRGLMVQVTNGVPGWTYTYTITDQTTEALPDVTAAYPVTSRPLLYVEQMPDGTPLSPTSEGYTFAVTATNESGSATGVSSTPQALVLNDSNTISELSVGKILAGDLVGAFALLGALAVGSSITIDDDNGIVISQPNGGRIKFPSDGSAADISAHLDAFSLTVRDRLSIRGLLNEVATGSVVALANGITAPGAPPQVSRSWPSKEFKFAPGFANTMGGLVRRAAGSWLSASVAFGASDIRECDDNGNGVAILARAGAGVYFLGGVTVIGSTCYALGYDTNQPDAAGAQPYRWFVYKFAIGSPWTYLGAWEYDLMSNSQTNPTIGRTESGDILIARCAPDGRPRVQQYAPATGAKIGAYVNLEHTVAASLTSVWFGWADFPAQRYVISTEQAIYTYGTALTRQESTEWSRANSSVVRGLTWDAIDGRFYSLDDTGFRWTYGKNVATVARSFSFSWFDSDSAGTGQHETDQSAPVIFDQTPRSWMTVNMPPPNDTGDVDDPNAVRVWIGGARQPDIGSALTVTYDLPGAAQGAKAPAFPAAAAAALLRSGASIGGDYTIRLSGNGAWRLGAISGSADGRVTGGAFVPIGGCIPHFGQTTPAGWLPANGSTYFYASTYPLLAAELGSAYIVTGGTDPLYVTPDATDRFIVGASAGKPKGSIGGAEELVAHQHFKGTLDTGSASATVGRASGSATPQVATAPHTHAVTGQTGGVVDNGTALHIPKYLSAPYIIRAA